MESNNENNNESNLSGEQMGIKTEMENTQEQNPQQQKQEPQYPYTFFIRDFNPAKLAKIFRNNNSAIKESKFLFDLASNLNPTETPSVKFYHNVLQTKTFYDYQPTTLQSRIQLSKHKNEAYDIVTLEDLQNINETTSQDLMDILEYDQYDQHENMARGSFFGPFTDTRQRDWNDYTKLDMRYFNLCSWDNSRAADYDNDNRVLISFQYVVKHFKSYAKYKDTNTQTHLDVFRYLDSDQEEKIFKVGLKQLYSLVEQVRRHRQEEYKYHPEENEQLHKNLLSTLDDFVFRKLCIYYNRIHDIYYGETGVERCFGSVVVYRSGVGDENLRNVEYCEDLSKPPYDLYVDVNGYMDFDQVFGVGEVEIYRYVSDVSDFSDDDDPLPIPFSIFQLFRDADRIVLSGPGQYFWGYVPNMTFEQLNQTLQYLKKMNLEKLWIHPEPYKVVQDGKFGLINLALIRLREYQLNALKQSSEDEKFMGSIAIVESILLSGNLISLILKLLNLQQQHGIDTLSTVKSLGESLYGEIDHKTMRVLIGEYHKLICYDLGFLICYFFRKII